jgi:hypothetical protein
VRAYGGDARLDQRMAQRSFRLGGVCAPKVAHILRRAVRDALQLVPARRRGGADVQQAQHRERERKRVAHRSQSGDEDARECVAARGLTGETPPGLQRHPREREARARVRWWLLTWR